MRGVLQERGVKENGCSGRLSAQARSQEDDFSPFPRSRDERRFSFSPFPGLSFPGAVFWTLPQGRSPDQRVTPTFEDIALNTKPHGHFPPLAEMLGRSGPKPWACGPGDSCSRTHQDHSKMPQRDLLQGGPGYESHRVSPGKAGTTLLPRNQWNGLHMEI